MLEITEDSFDIDNTSHIKQNDNEITFNMIKGSPISWVFETNKGAKKTFCEVLKIYEGFVKVGDSFLNPTRNIKEICYV